MTVYPVNQDNPFRRDEKGQIRSPMEISKLIIRDFDRAVQLCKEAGEPLHKWFDLNPR